MKKKTLLAVVLLVAIPLFGFAFLVYGPATLVPPPNWPFTEDSRRQYDPFGAHSRLVVKTYLDDAVHGRLTVK